MDLETLRKMRKSSTGTLDKIANELQKQESGKGNQDDRMWKAEVDKAGNGSAVIRFLPARDDDELPWVKVYSHGFQGPSGKWYIEECRTTIGENDPVVEHCNELWATGLEADKELARKRKRRLSYICNVLVIKDPANPENEGKVKLFKFGKKLFDKIKDKIQPSFEDIQPVDVFNPWEGANFRLRIMKVDGYSNTDKSEFDSPSVISDDDEELLEILNSRHRLGEFTDPSRFKSYEDLERKLNFVLGNTSTSAQKKAEDYVLDDEPKEKEPRKPVKEKEEPKAPAKDLNLDDDDDMSFFEKLANGDDDIPF